MARTVDSVLGDPERIAALKRTNLLDSAPEEAFDRLTRLASLIIGAPTSLVSLVDAERQFFKSAEGLGEPWKSRRETPLAYSFCQHAVHSGRDLIIDDARSHPLVKDNLAVSELETVAYAGVPLIDEDGHALGSFCVIDSEPRKWTEQEIEILRELATSVMTEIRLRSMVVGLQEIDRMRAELIAVISHDLRNPLSAIIGSASLLKSHDGEVSSSDRISFLEAIEGQARRMLEMTEDMLARSKADADAAQMKREAVELAPVLERVVTSFRLAGCKNPIEVETRARPIVDGDARMIEQVMTNLIDNASKYSTSDSPIFICLRQEGSQAVLEVSDRGVGIDEEAIRTIFQPFKQVEGNDDISMGVGLGLHIVRRFVEMHGGTISVSSKIGEGSTFSVSLPIT